LTIVRILIASYFRASATAEFLNPTGRVLLDTLLAPEIALNVATFWVFATGLALMIGVAVRPAAILLALFVLASGVVHIGPGVEQAVLSGYLSDMALLGTLLLVTLTGPGGSARFRLAATTLEPRRVAVQATPHRVTRNGIVVTDDDDEVDNIFADLWDRPAVKGMA